MLYRYFGKIGKDEEEIIPISVTLLDFTGDIRDAKGAMVVNLMIRSRTTKITFFMIDVNGSYNLLLGRDCIHSNQYIPSSLHQRLAF
ncbi:hypothetical protein ACJRO7_008955 [Eucalyptus globulus]|uniref:Uncharacterized protein n=1 Tax=Eucalyptus globulus TaxID=34317 RepID=A0ABD3IT52_EUCGL